MSTTAVRCVVGGLLLLLAVGTSSWAQGPPPPPPPPPMPVGAGTPTSPVMPAPQGTAIIFGQVVDAGSGRPVPGAVVNITSPRGEPADPTQERQIELIAAGLLPGPPSSTPVLTDGDGRFMFRNLAKGAHTLRVTAAGYVVSGYGQTRPEGGARPVELDTGERRLDVSIRIWKMAAITGTVVDDVGDPVIGRPVRALRRTWSAGRMRFASGSSTTTDDRGRFRLSNLIPGDYVVASPATVSSVPVSAVEEYYRASAAGSSTAISRERLESGAPFPTGAAVRVGDINVQLSSGSANVVPSSDTSRVVIYPTTYFGSTATVADATVLTIGSGEERGGVDLQVVPVTGVSVSGTITGPADVIGGIGVRMVPVGNDRLASDAGFETAIGQADGTGRFTFPAVPPGQYLLRAYRVPRGEMIVTESISMAGGMTTVSAIATSAASPTGPAYYGQIPLSVGDRDVSGVSLAISTGSRVSGRIEFRGASPPDPKRIAQLPVSIAPIDVRTYATVPSTGPDEHGRFTTAGVPPGRYTLNVGTPGAGWTMESVLVNGVNALERPIVVGDTDITDAVITFIQAVSELTGTVDRPAEARTSATIVLFPADVSGWIADGMMPRRMVTTRALDSGAFSLRPPGAGDYLVAALPDEVPVEMSPAFFTSLARTATRVSFTSGEKKSLSLTVPRR